jgi:hypothetical protein
MALRRSSSAVTSSDGWKSRAEPTREMTVRSPSRGRKRSLVAAMAGSWAATVSGRTRLARISAEKASRSAGEGSSPSNIRCQTSSSDRFSARSVAEYWR